MNKMNNNDWLNLLKEHSQSIQAMIDEEQKELDEALAELAKFEAIENDYWYSDMAEIMGGAMTDDERDCFGY